jgi:ADP-heptose:LPS heptosyltransferase
MNNEKMIKDKIFLLADGGAGRVFCAIPALEHYALTHDNFHIITYYKSDFFAGNPILEKYTHHLDDEDLFVNIIKGGEVIKPEPYFISEYFNQKCSIAQAFDLEINGKHSIENKLPKIYFNPSENTKAKQFIEDLKREYKKDKVLVLQPFGQDAQVFSDGIFDHSSRSFAMENIITIASRLKKDYLILCMGPLRLNISNVINGVNIHDNTLIYLDTTLRNWAGYIKFADHFLGCDSVGQHLAKSVNQRSTVVIGGTFPVNVSYPNDDKFTVFDLGKERRVYDPLRILVDQKIVEANKGIMAMDDVTIDKIIDNIVNSP